MDYSPWLLGVLTDISARACSAMAASHVGPGKGRPVGTRGGLSARGTCALFVFKAWTVARGSYPGADNEDASSICDAYWAACGQRTDRTGNRPGDWSDHLKRARDYLAEPTINVPTEGKLDTPQASRHLMSAYFDGLKIED